MLERRLTTILAADVVGYSRLMAADEPGTLAALKAHRTEIMDPKTAEWIESNYYLSAPTPEGRETRRLPDLEAGHKSEYTSINNHGWLAGYQRSLELPREIKDYRGFIAIPVE